MRIRLFIGAEQVDFSESFNVMFSIGDVREPSFGNANKTYTLTLPLTKTNKKLLKYVTQPDVRTEPTARGWLYLDEMLIISGKVVVMSADDYSSSIIITSDDWIDSLKNKRMIDIDLSASDHTLTHTNVEDSWSASYPVYRYPMIDFGALQSGESGSSAKWIPTDFIPMISLKTLIEKILAPHTVSSTWLVTNYVKDIFILGRETIAPEEFIKGKNLSVAVDLAADNQHTEVVPAGESVTSSMTNYPIKFYDETTNEGGNFLNDTYTVPETGTYRFKIGIVTYSTNGYVGFTETAGSFSLELKQAGSASRTLWSVTTSRVPAATTYNIDTYYVHLVAGDTIQLILDASSTCTNNTGISVDLVVGTGAGTLELIWGMANRYAGLNKTISLEEMLPDMTQLDFLSAVRDIFNLRFFKDQSRNVVYVEPWDTFTSSTVVNLTSYIDFQSVHGEMISNSYSRDIYLRWKDDEADKAFEEYYKYHTSVKLNEKHLILTSEFAKKDITINENTFSTVVPGGCIPIYDEVNNHAKIYAEYPVAPYEIFNRMTGFNTRMVHWEGLTSGLTWYYETETHSNYPKITGIDWSDIYLTYWQKFYHWVDRGKLYTFRMKVTPSFINQFFTVVNSASSEGFRVTYQVTLNGISHYFIMQKLTTDGNTAEIEMILRQ